MALARTGHPADVIHHADKGTHYTSLDFAFAAGNADMHLSFGSTGDCLLSGQSSRCWLRSLVFVLVEACFGDLIGLQM